MTNANGRLILVRHGETPSNVAKLLDTKLPGAPLTESGVAQAKAFGAQLTTAPRALFSSQAQRARQTAEYIGAAVGLAPVVLDGLHEVQLGDLDAKSDPESFRQFAAIFHAWHAGDLTARAPGGESGREVLDRIIPVLTELRRTYLEHSGVGNILVVSHGAAIRLTARYLSDVPWLFAANNHLDNTSTVELVPAPDGGWTCVRWGRTDPPFVNTAPTPDQPMG